MSLPQRRMLQQLLEARAMATEAFLVASWGLHHNWQGEQAHEGRLVFFFNKRCLNGWYIFLFTGSCPALKSG